MDRKEEREMSMTCRISLVLLTIVCALGCASQQAIHAVETEAQRIAAMQALQEESLIEKEGLLELKGSPPKKPSYVAPDMSWKQADMAATAVVAQKIVDEKKEKATWIIDNSKNLKHLQQEVEDFVEIIKEKYL